MKKQFSEANEQFLPRKINGAVDYSARIQEVMRYDKLRSSDYPLVMTILRAVKLGYTEEKWQEEQQRTLKALADQSPDQGAVHSDAPNRYEQAVYRLKDLMLWPW